MKKFLSILLSLLLLVSLTACGGKSAPSEPVQPDPPKENPVSVVPETPPDAPAPVVLEGDSYWVAYESEGNIRWIKGNRSVWDIFFHSFIIQPLQLLNCSCFCSLISCNFILCFFHFITFYLLLILGIKQNSTYCYSIKYGFSC